jgi:hypothetical protein
MVRYGMKINEKLFPVHITSHPSLHPVCDPYCVGRVVGQGREGGGVGWVSLQILGSFYLPPNLTLIFWSCSNFQLPALLLLLLLLVPVLKFLSL